MSQVEFMNGRLLTNIKLAFKSIGEFLYPQHIIVDNTGAEVGFGLANDTPWNGSNTSASMIAIQKALHNVTKDAIGAELDTTGRVFHPSRLTKAVAYARTSNTTTITTTVNGVEGTWKKIVVQTFSDDLIVSETDSGWEKQP